MPARTLATVDEDFAEIDRLLRELRRRGLRGRDRESRSGRGSEGPTHACNKTGPQNVTGYRPK